MQFVPIFGHFCIYLLIGNLCKQQKISTHSFSLQKLLLAKKSAGSQKINERRFVYFSNSNLFDWCKQVSFSCLFVVHWCCFWMNLSRNKLIGFTAAIAGCSRFVILRFIFNFPHFSYGFWHHRRRKNRLEFLALDPSEAVQNLNDHQLVGVSIRSLEALYHLNGKLLNI
jgi:hypothetical protein